MAKTIRTAFIMAFLIVTLCKVRWICWNLQIFFCFSLSMYVNRQWAFFPFYIVKLVNLCVCILVFLIEMQESKVVWFAGFLSCFGVLSSQNIASCISKSGLSPKSRRFFPKRRSLLSRKTKSLHHNSSFFRKKRRFPSSNTTFYFLQSSRFLQVLGK